MTFQNRDLRSPTATDDRPIATPARADVALALLCVAQLMLVLDFSIVNVALPAMRADLQFTDAGLQ